MIDAADIEKLASILAEQLDRRTRERLAEELRHTIPLSVDLWDFETIGAYLKREPNSVRLTIACLPDFPKPIRLPSVRGTRRGHPLWKAVEVIKWAEGHRDGDVPGRPGRPRNA